MQLRLQQLLSWSNYPKYDFSNLKQLSQTARYLSSFSLHHVIAVTFTIIGYLSNVTRW